MSVPIIAGVDGSAAALRAVRWAADEARLRHLPLRLVHAHETPVGFPPGFVDWHALRQALVAQGKAWLEQARQAVVDTAPSLAVEVVEEGGRAVPALLTESAHAAMLAVGTRGLGGFTGLLTGSTAVELAAHARCPVVVVRGTGHAGGPVVVGVDGTPVSEQAIAFAFAEASARGTGLVAVHTWTDLLLEAALGSAAALDFSPMAQQAEEVLGERLAGWQERYPDVRVSRHVSRERASRALLRHAEGAQVVVVGSRGRGGFRGLLLGSTSQHMLHHTPCPVVVIRSTPEAG